MNTILCDCGKRVANAQALKQHKLDSPRHNTTSCECGARFVTPEARDQHLRDSPLHTQKDHPQSTTQSPHNNNNNNNKTSVQSTPNIPAETTTVPAEPKPLTEAKTEKPNFQCCGKKFKTKKDVLQHQADSPNHHGESPKKAPRKRRSGDRAWAAPQTSSYRFQFPESDMEYGACDKDCGWCGNCMRGLDI